MAEGDLGAFESAADHRRAEIVSGKLWDKVPSHVWRYVD
ncbi:Hha/YmoA family nucleoid-associated regulatory protein [Escherichia coli]